MILITWFYKAAAMKTEMTSVIYSKEGKNIVRHQINMGLYLPPGNWDKYEMTESK